MTYPATTYAEGVELTITSGNQLHEIINGDATEEINTESGMVPSVRKALADSMLFKPAIAWAEGSVESDPFQTRLYGEGIYWAPAASNETPISMGTNPNIDGNWFLAPVTGGESISRNTNLLSNHNFIIQSPDNITYPSITPTDYVAGTQVFSGVFVGDDIVGLTYIDGRVSWTSGTLYFSVPNSGALEYADQTDFVVSVADFDGKPRTRGVSYSLVGDEYRVTVGVDALEDESANETLLGSVKFEQGSVATGHEAQSYKGHTYSFGSVAEAVANCPSVGSTLAVDDYYGGDSANNSGVLFFKVVSAGTGTDDGGKYIDVDSTRQLEQNINKNSLTYEAYGAVGDGSTNDTVSVSNCINSGYESVFGLGGKTYLIDPIVASNANLRRIDSIGRCTFLTNPYSSSQGVTVTQRQYIKVDNIFFKSNGSPTDGLNTSGLVFEEGCSLIETGFGLQTLDYSFRGVRIIQCVAATLKEFVGNGGGYTLSLEKSAGGTPCTTVTIEQPYILGGLRGIFSDGTVGLHIIDPKFESCGSSTTNDAALHIQGGTVVVENRYFETNNRDIITSDANVLWVGEAFKAGALAPDVYAYSGIPAADRAQGTLTNKTLSIREIKPDEAANADLIIGSNLTVPVNGSSANFGGNTTETIKGTATQSVWTPIYTLESQSGDGATRVGYRYAIYLGQADKTTGYDMGHIFNGSIFSASGVLPAWLRVNSGSIEVNTAQDSYGLTYGLNLIKTEAIGAP